MTNIERHVDVGMPLTAFSDEVLVICKECGAPGVVRATWLPYKWHARFTCGACRLALSSEAGDWVGPVRFGGRRPCGHCGHQWLTASAEYAAAPAHPPAHIAASCPQCGKQTEVAVLMERCFPEDRCCDPHFGLPLRLAISTRHGTVWAYNMPHLNELSGYINAKLRERQNSPHSGMFSRLPKWMKLAKHRDDIAKALGRLYSLV